jgi:hypothetical protein
MTRTLHVSLSTEARETLRQSMARANRAGQTLRDWLVRSFEATATSRAQQASLFAETIPVDDDVPLLLEALARVTRRTPDDLVEAWALEEPTQEERAGQAQTTTPPVSLPEDVRGKVSELLDLVETLFEETIADAQRRLGGYPEGQEAERAAAELYRALRSVLALSRE